MTTTLLGQPINDSTQWMGLPLPHIDNYQEDDVLRLRAGFEMIDAGVQLMMQELDTKADDAQVSAAVAQLMQAIGTKADDAQVSAAVAQLMQEVEKKASTVAMHAALALKQNNFVSGETLKTINGESMLGAGDLTVDYLSIPQVIQSAAYTGVLSDQGKHLLHPSTDTAARIFTIPANSSVAYPIGTALTFVNQSGAGILTIGITTDVMRLAGTGVTGSRTLAANGIATAIKLTATEWIISGTGLT